MKNLKQDLKLTSAVSEGWAVHIYDGDRRLRCTLEPSHGWAFVAGIGLGITIATIGISLYLPAGSKSSAAPPRTATTSPSAANGAHHSPDDSIFWID